MDKQCDHNSLLNEIKETREVLTQQISAQGSDVKILQHVVFGNEESHEKGMKEKVDEIHDMLIQAKGLSKFFGGVRGTLGLLLVVGAVITLIKTWIK